MVDELKKKSHSLGDAYRTFPPGRLRLAPHGVHVLQDVRAVFPRSGRLRRVQWQALRTRRDLLADKWSTRSRVRRRDARRARGPSRRWALGRFRCPEYSGAHTDAARRRLWANGDERCVHSDEHGSWRRREVVLSFRCVTFALDPPPRYLYMSNCSRSKKPLPPPCPPRAIAVLIPCVSSLHLSSHNIFSFY